MMNDTQLPTLSGMVTHGQAIGRTYGMPTANLPIPADTPLPPCGARRAGGDRNAPAGF